jgi:hypothetical protein
MLINIQCYLVDPLFTVMIFVCVFHGMTDAQHQHKKLGKSRSKHLNYHHSTGYIRPHRFE